MTTLKNLPHYPQGSPAEARVMHHLQTVEFNRPDATELVRTLFRVSDLLLANVEQSIPYRFEQIDDDESVNIRRFGYGVDIQINVRRKSALDERWWVSDPISIPALVLSKSTIKRICDDNRVFFSRSLIFPVEARRSDLFSFDAVGGGVYCGNLTMTIASHLKEDAMSGAAQYV